MGLTFRDRLRADTRAAHEDVDAAFSAHDPTSLAGYAGFLAAHDAALRTLDRDTTLPPPLRARITRDIALIGRDLAHLGACADRMPLPSAHVHDPVAVEYIHLGSRMGLKIILNRWRQSRDDRVGVSAAFLSATDPPDLWRHFCTRLATMPVSGPVADRIVTDCISLFSIYALAARTAPLFREPDCHERRTIAAE